MATEVNALDRAPDPLTSLTEPSCPDFTPLVSALSFILSDPITTAFTLLFPSLHAFAVSRCWACYGVPLPSDSVQAPVKLHGLDGRYATSLWKVAAEKKELDKVEKDLAAFKVLSSTLPAHSLSHPSQASPPGRSVCPA